MLPRITRALVVFLTIPLLAAPNALAATPSESSAALPPGANGYHSALYNYEQMKTEKAATHSTASVTNGVNTPSSPWSCVGQGWIASKYSGLYVSTELGYHGSELGMLRARSSSVGPWELYQLCGNAHTGALALFADANATWVSTELGYSGILYGMLRARGTSIGPWEEYSGEGTVNLFYLYSNANFRWVSTEYGDSGNWWGMLRARSTEVGQWEEYFGTAF
jgi:hypothetical protein